MRPTESTRSLPVAFLAVLAVLFLARVATAMWESRNPPEVLDRVEWRTPAEAAAFAAMHRRPILYEFSADWCGPCQRMKREVFSDRGRAAQITRMFVPAKVVDRQQEEGHNPADIDSLQRRYAVTVFPTLIAATPDGDEVGRVLGYPGDRATMDSLQVFYRRFALAQANTMPGGAFGRP